MKSGWAVWSVLRGRCLRAGCYADTEQLCIGVPLHLESVAVCVVGQQSPDSVEADAHCFPLQQMALQAAAFTWCLLFSMALGRASELSQWGPSCRGDSRRQQGGFGRPQQEP